MQNQFWESVFRLTAKDALPLNVQLRTSLVQAIFEQRLPAGMALPSSRALAAILGIGRNTVTAAYEQLIEEGFLVARARHGVFVSQTPPAADVRPAFTTPRSGASLSRTASASDHHSPDWASRSLRSVRHNPTLSKPPAWSEMPYPFVYGLHDTELFPTDDFRECCTRILARSQHNHWTPDFEDGDLPEMVDALRQKVLPKRGVFVSADEILVTVGAQQAFFLIAELLLDQGTRLGLEEPGYPHARNTFALRDPVLLPVAVDAEGICTQELPPLDYLFVTPSHQSPTTASLSLERRHELLRRADADDFVVIEDDYEAENLYEGNPLPSLKSLDRNGRVIYIGSLSKSLAPVVRLGYIVAPAAVIAELRALRHAMVRHPSPFLQYSYALFISLGHHESHARRVNRAMSERIHLAATALEQYLPDFHFEIPKGGASIWVRGPDWLDCDALAEAAKPYGVLLEPGRVFFSTPPMPCPYFRLRLSSICPGHIAGGIQALAKAVNDLREGRRVSESIAR